MNPNMKNEAGVPFVARHRKLLTPSESAGPSHVYDGFRQLWVCAVSGEPLVVRHARQASLSLVPSEFGETAMTKTVEGIDQSEGRGVSGGCADEASLPTRSRGLAASRFGETLLTMTAEGVDQSERATGL
jgi:hypothetical protein